MNAGRSMKKNLLSLSRRRAQPLISAAMALVLIAASVPAAPATGISASASQETELIKVGERLTYTIRIDGFDNAGIVDLRVVSEGKFEGSDVFEVSLKMKTFEIVNAAFFPIDETWTSYLAKASGLPIAVKRVVDPAGFPSATDASFLNRAPAGLDLIAALFKVRRAGGTGKFRLTENGRNYWIDAESGESRRVRTEAGDFTAVESKLRSEYFSEIGVSDVRVLLSADAAKIPVLFEFVTKLGPASVRLTSIQSGSSTADTGASQKPVTPPGAGTGKPVVKPTPMPYVDNKPLGEDVPFGLGESLSYRVRNGASVIGTVKLDVKERKLFEGKDRVLFAGTVTEASPNAGIFKKDDRMSVWADPGSFLPSSAELAFNGTLGILNYAAKFDQASGTATPAGGAPMTVPVGTHSLQSLIYAIRTFNLKQSSSTGNPVNDTRVSVFWNKMPLVFTIRPGGVQPVSVNGVSLRAQLVEIITGNAELDSMKLRVWLTDDDVRTPVKMSVGTFTAELISSPGPSIR